MSADRTWHRNWALPHLVLETLRGRRLEWPTRPDLDLPALRRALAG